MVGRWSPAACTVSGLRQSQGILEEPPCGAVMIGPLQPAALRGSIALPQCPLLHSVLYHQEEPLLWPFAVMPYCHCFTIVACVFSPVMIRVRERLDVDRRSPEGERRSPSEDEAEEKVVKAEIHHAEDYKEIFQPKNAICRWTTTLHSSHLKAGIYFNKHATCLC